MEEKKKTAISRWRSRWKELYWQNKVSIVCIIIAVICTAINLTKLVMT